MSGMSDQEFEKLQKNVMHISYMLNEKNQWELTNSYYPNDFSSKTKIPSLPEYSYNLFKYHEQSKVFIIKKGIKREAIVQSVIIVHWFYKDNPANGWHIMYDLKWTGEGHTHGWIEQDDILDE
jgi:hypothetical protein